MSNIKETIKEAFYFRHACKKFDENKHISDKDFHTILEAGRLSPSSFGLEPWKFLVIKNPDLKCKLYPFAWGGQASLEGASHFVIILARKKVDMVYDSEYIHKMMVDVQKLPPNIVEVKSNIFKKFETHDFDLLSSDRAIFDWACKQTYIALGNMLTVAALLKIDSCPIEGFDRKAVEKLLADEGVIDVNHFGVAVMAGFGYRGEAPRHEKTRKSFEEVVEEI